MEKWKKIAASFIDSCSFRDEIEAVFLTGSHAVGNADEFSDIDLFIVLNDNANWRERGNKRMDDLLIEYFANPVRQVKKSIDENFENACLIEITMVLNGIIILNKNSTAEKIIDYCQQKKATDFPSMSKFNLVNGLYHLWDNLDELARACTKQTPDAAMHFYSFVKYAFELYSRYICAPVPNFQKLHRWLTDDSYAKNYGLPTYKNPAFLEIIKPAFECSGDEAMLKVARMIHSYVEEKMGGFDVDNFVLHGPCS
ncbi:MAG: nucleotidyltransferase domain-containing protein [Defluviitaleaceae bacterium]|nr:nucleotidyltransferase domain-containing protein [Defluviitaleaceae bacterium]